MNDTDLMKLMDLSGELGLVLRMNPVWKKECVIYGGNLDDPYIMYFSLDNSRWEIVTDAYGVLNLPQEAIALMDRMSKLAKGKEIVNIDIGELEKIDQDYKYIVLAYLIYLQKIGCIAYDYDYFGEHYLVAVKSKEAGQ